MMRVSCMAAAAVALLGMSCAVDAVTVTFKNSCSYKIELYSRQGGATSDGTSSIAPGATNQKQFGKDYEGHFRHGQDDAATLVEFSTKGSMNYVWFDISIIPPRLNKGYEFCKSLDECKANSQSKKGFNVPIQMTPQSNTNGNQCRELTCLADGCTDAYLFPQDDTKTHACNLDTDFTVTFCPGGSSGGDSSTTPAPTSTTATPQTTAPTTPAPTTPAPTTANPTTPAPITFTQTTAPPASATTATPVPAENGKIHVPDDEDMVVDTPAPTQTPTTTPAAKAESVVVPSPVPTSKAQKKKKNLKHCE